MANISKIPREVSNSEIEKNEFVVMPNMMTFLAKGNNHNTDITKKGGIPTILSEGSRIFSHKLKADRELVTNLVGKDKVMSYADMAKMYNTIPELKDLLDPKSDDLSKKTSQLMLTKKIAQLDGIFNAQETVKQDKSTKSLNEILGDIIPKGNGSAQAMTELENPQFQSGGYFNPIRPIVPKSLQYNPFKKVDDSLLSPNNNGFNFLGRNIVNRQEQLFPESAMVQQNLFGQTLYNDPRVGEYQMKAIGYDKDKGYLTDPLSQQVRRETVKHIFDDYASPNWKHIDIFDNKGNPIIKSGKRLVDNLPEGDFKFSDRKNAMGFTMPSYVDYDNVRYQPPMYRNITEEQILGNPTTITPTPLTTIPTNPDGTPINLPNNPTKNNIPISSKTNVPLQGRDPIKDTYLMSMFRDLGDLGGLEIRPPEYNYQPQNIAYQRFLPQNTLATERQFNMQKQSIENSNLPEQVKQSMLADLSGKLQDGISEVQMRNFQGDNQNDNNNVNFYNQVTDSNRKERIGYDDKYNELQDRTLFNYGQEKLRLQDQLLSTYGKYGQNQLMKNLVNSLGQNYFFDGSNIQYVPNRGIRDNSNPLQQYGNEDAIQRLVKQLNSTTDPVAMKNIAEAIKALQGN